MPTQNLTRAPTAGQLIATLASAQNPAQPRTSFVPSQSSLGETIGNPTVPPANEEDLEQRKQGFKNFISKIQTDPNFQQALNQASISLSQFEGEGTFVQELGNAFQAALGTINALEQQERDNTRADKELESDLAESAARIAASEASIAQGQQRIDQGAQELEILRESNASRAEQDKQQTVLAQERLKQAQLQTQLAIAQINAGQADTRTALEANLDAVAQVELAANPSLTPEESRALALDRLQPLQNAPQSRIDGIIDNILGNIDVSVTREEDIENLKQNIKSITEFLAQEESPENVFNPQELIGQEIETSEGTSFTIDSFDEDSDIFIVDLNGEKRQLSGEVLRNALSADNG